MKKHTRIATLVVTSALLFGCKRNHGIDVGSADHFNVLLFQGSATGAAATRKCKLLPGSQGFDEVAGWLSANRDGWADYIATPAVGAGSVWGSQFRLHVYDDFVVLAVGSTEDEPRQLAKESLPGELDFVLGLCSE